MVLFTGTHQYNKWIKIENKKVSNHRMSTESDNRAENKRNSYTNPGITHFDSWYEIKYSYFKLHPYVKTSIQKSAPQPEGKEVMI